MNYAQWDIGMKNHLKKISLSPKSITHEYDRGPADLPEIISSVMKLILSDIILILNT